MNEATTAGDLSCQGCGGPIKPRTYRGGPRQKWCSEACRVRAYYKKKDVREYYAPRCSVYYANCEMCGIFYCGRGTGNRRYFTCGELCAKAHKAARERARYETESDRILASQKKRRENMTDEERARVSAYSRAYAAKNGRHPTLVANDARRRLIKAQSPERFNKFDVAERDEWSCWLCEGDVNPEVSWPHPLSASMDHILPLSLGGTHEMKNVKLAHLRCNVRRGNRIDIAEAGMAKLTNPTWEVSDGWSWSCSEASGSACAWV